MAKVRNKLRVQIKGQGIFELFECMEHEPVGFPASTYHKFTYADGTVTFFNDFGVRTVTVEQVKPA